MDNILLVAVRLVSEAAVWRGSEKYMRKALKNSSKKVHFLVMAQFTDLQC